MKNHSIARTSALAFCSLLLIAGVASCDAAAGSSSSAAENGSSATAETSSGTSTEASSSASEGSSSSSSPSSSSSSSSSESVIPTDWTAGEKALMVADFGEALPFADGLTSTYTCAESAGLSDGSKAIAIADENSGDITEAYKTALAAAGFAYAPERSDDDWGYWVYLFDKHPEGETNERKVLSVQIDYYPGGTTAAAEFEINYMYYIYPVT